MTFSFKCSTCSETHHGMPTFGARAPLSYYEVPEQERATRCDLSNRPNLELEPTDHPLAVEQREGISVGRVADIYSIMMHQDE